MKIRLKVDHGIVTTPTATKKRKKNKQQEKGKGIGQKMATVPYHCSFCPISFRLLCLARGGPYLPYSQRWVWLGHCSESHTPGISPRFYLGLPWSRFHGNCRGWGGEGRRVRSYFQDPETHGRAAMRCPFTPTKATKTHTTNTAETLSHTYTPMHKKTLRGRQSRVGEGDEGRGEGVLIKK